MYVCPPHTIGMRRADVLERAGQMRLLGEGAVPGEAAEVRGQPVAGGAVVASGGGMETLAARLPALRVLRLPSLLAALARLRSLPVLLAPPIRCSVGCGRAVLAEHRAPERGRAPAAASSAGILRARRLGPWLGRRVRAGACARSACRPFRMRRLPAASPSSCRRFHRGRPCLRPAPCTCRCVCRKPRFPRGQAGASACP